MTLADERLNTLGNRRVMLLVSLDIANRSIGDGASDGRRPLIRLRQAIAGSSIEILPTIRAAEIRILAAQIRDGTLQIRQRNPTTPVTRVVQHTHDETSGRKPIRHGTLVRRLDAAFNEPAVVLHIVPVDLLARGGGVEGLV